MFKSSGNINYAPKNLSSCMIDPENTGALIALPLLREKREAFCTQQEMVDYLRTVTPFATHRNTYRKMEFGEQLIQPETAFAIQRILKVSFDQLFRKPTEDERSHYGRPTDEE